MIVFQRVSGWTMFCLSILGLFQVEWLKGLIQVEKGSLIALALLGIVSLASIHKSWLLKWTWIVGILYLLLGITGIVSPDKIFYHLQPFEALIFLAFSTWAIYQALSMRKPDVPTA